MHTRNYYGLLQRKGIAQKVQQVVVFFFLIVFCCINVNLPPGYVNL